jgi:hypothetical protein
LNSAVKLFRLVIEHLLRGFDPFLGVRQTRATSGLDNLAFAPETDLTVSRGRAESGL